MIKLLYVVFIVMELYVIGSHRMIQKSSMPDGFLNAHISDSSLEKISTKLYKEKVVNFAVCTMNEKNEYFFSVSI